jgi:biopolymer transport protein ExbD
MRVKSIQPKHQNDGTIAFINIIFLILIFLLIAGTLSGFDAGRVDPVIAREAELGAGPHDAVVLRADGAITWRGNEYDFDSIGEKIRKEAAAGTGRFRVYADRGASASGAIKLVAVIRASGAKDVFFVVVRETPK